MQACGDAHLVNFGIFATPERHLVFDVNDFDETLPGPWEWDLKRLGASIAVASRENGCNRDDGDAAVLSAVGAYRQRMYELATMRTLDLWYSRVDVDEIMMMVESMAADPIGRMAAKTIAKARTHDTLAAVAKLTEVVDGRRRIVDHPPLIDHVALANAADQIRMLYEGYLASLSPELQTLMNRFELVDVARKVVGVGSVGTRCWIALFEGGADDDPLLLQIKEAQASVLEHELHIDSIYRNHGERVVHGQKMMQATSDLFLGWSLNPATGVHYYWRQLHDMKGSADVPAMSPLQLAGLRPHLRLRPGPGARPQRRRGHDQRLPGIGRHVRPGPRRLLPGLRRPERARLRGHGRRRQERSHRGHRGRLTPLRPADSGSSDSRARAAASWSTGILVRASVPLRSRTSAATASTAPATKAPR